MDTFMNLLKLIDVPKDTFDNDLTNAIVESALKKHSIKTDVDGLRRFIVDPKIQNMNLAKPHEHGSFFDLSKVNLLSESMRVFGPASKGPPGLGSYGTPLKPGSHLREVTPKFSPPMPTPKSIFEKIEFKQYSVCGETGQNYDSVAQGNYTPVYNKNINFSTTALVDAGGLNFFKDIPAIKGRKRTAALGPKGAGGSSGDLYKFLNINRDAYFDSAISPQIKGIGDAVFHTYNKSDAPLYHVIHAIGPDFTKNNIFIMRNINIDKRTPLDYRIKNFDKDKKDDVVLLLSRVYYNIFKKFIDNNDIIDNKGKTLTTLTTLNIVPISVGIFASTILNTPYKASKLTMASIFKALEILNKENEGILQELDDIEINICLWNDIEKVGKILNCKREQSLCYMYNEAKEKILSTSRGGHFNSHSIKQKYNKIIKKRTLRKKNKTHKKVKLYKI